MYTYIQIISMMNYIMYIYVYMYVCECRGRGEYIYIIIRADDYMGKEEKKTERVYIMGILQKGVERSLDKCIILQPPYYI